MVHHMYLLRFKEIIWKVHKWYERCPTPSTGSVVPVVSNCSKRPIYWCDLSASWFIWILLLPSNALPVIYSRIHSTIRRKGVTHLDGVAFCPVWVSLFLQGCTSGHGGWFRTRRHLSQSMFCLLALKSCTWNGAFLLLSTCSYPSFPIAPSLGMNTSRLENLHLIPYKMVCFFLPDEACNRWIMIH